MEEAGFVRVKVFCLPRNIIDDDGSDDSDEESDQASEPDAPADEDAGLENMAALIRRTEKEEKRRAFYRSLGQGEKLFANRSFGSECRPTRNHGPTRSCSCSNHVFTLPFGVMFKRLAYIVACAP